MRFDTSQHMKLGQQMKLAPRMIQSMEILQMPLAELRERIEQELESNVALELVEQRGDRDEIQRQRDEDQRAATEDEREIDVDESGRRDFERLEAFEQTHPDAAENQFDGRADQWRDYEPGSFSPSRMAGERDGKMDAMASAPARSAPLSDQLLEQWRLAELDERTQALGELMISFLEDDGYLRTPLETIADRAPRTDGSPAPDTAELEQALSLVQSVLEPPGIAARDARECLLLQLDALGRDGEPDPAIDTARALVADHLDDLMNNRLPRIAERAELTLDQIKAGIELLRRLSIAPARRLVHDSPTPIIPDAIVEYDEDNDRYVAYLNDTRMPNLRVNREYAYMTRDRSVPKKDRDFIRTNLSNAQWLIDAVNQRKHTLLRVINVVVQAQRDYFDEGPQALKPLPMTQVAEQLGIHVATVSRAVADKYIQTPRGVVPLRGFFSGGLQTESGGEVSYDAVKAALKEVIDAEDKHNPLSDEALVEEMHKRGIEIARRTVAKYRGQLGIPTARLRKAY